MMIVLMAVLLSTAPAATQTESSKGSAGKAAGNADEMICKRFAETGSLVRTTKVCKTRADWERERDHLREPGTVSGCNNTGSLTPC